MSDGPVVLLVEDEAQMRRFLRAALTATTSCWRQPVKKH